MLWKTENDVFTSRDLHKLIHMKAKTPTGQTAQA